MRVRVLFFSVLRDLATTSEVELLLPAGATVTVLLDQLFSRWPALQDWNESLLVAVDQTYARRADPLHDHAEVAVMPPVQGG